MQAGRVNRCDSDKAREFIKENFNVLTKYQMTKHLVKNTRLKESSVLRIYKEVELEREIYIREGRIEEKVTTYKGRSRSFFRFDDSKLYKGLIKG